MRLILEIKKVGTSMGLILPKSAAENEGLAIGTKVEVVLRKVG